MRCFSEVSKLNDSVKLQFPYELSFLSVFLITSKSNQKHRLDVVSEVFYGSGRNKNMTQRGIRLLNSIYSKTSMPLYMVPESFVLQEVHKMTK